MSEIKDKCLCCGTNITKDKDPPICFRLECKINYLIEDDHDKNLREVVSNDRKSTKKS